MGETTMKSFRWQTFFRVMGVLALGSSAHAQRKPHIGYVYPAGGRQGTTLQAAMAGQYLDGANAVVVSGEGVEATVLEHVKPLNGKEINLLRDRLKALQAVVNPPKAAQTKNGADSGTTPAAEPPLEISPADARKEIAEIRAKLANPKNRNREDRQLSEDIKLEIRLAPNAAPGRRELRLKTNLGLSNPVVFHVGRMAEYVEKEPNDKAADADVPTELPLVLNGRIMAGDVDRFELKLKKGTPLVMAASARELVPYLADAVPGWFQATLGLYDSEGNQVAYADDFRFHPDPVLFCEIPQDGQYALEIKDAIYRGREDFVYRITVGPLPYVTSIFPMGGPANAATTVAMTGWNLPTKTTTVKPDAGAPGIMPLSLGEKQIVCSLVPFAVDVLPECTDKEPNNQQAGSQEVTPPIIVNGRIDKSGDWDVFRFKGRAGDAVVAEVCARRLGSPLDSVLKLIDAAGKVLTASDDHEDKAMGLMTHHADSLISTTLPADGTYYLCLGDAQHKGGQAYGYRLRISPPRPDVALRVVPSSVNVRPGAAAALTVYALRKDGFSGDVALALKDAPKGFSINPVRIPADKDQVRIMLRAPRTANRAPMSFRLEGRVEIDGAKVTRPVVPADDMMQAFIYRHLVPAQELKVAVVGRLVPPRHGQGARQGAANKPAPGNKQTATQKSAEANKPAAGKNTPAKSPPAK